MPLAAVDIDRLGVGRLTDENLAHSVECSGILNRERARAVPMAEHNGCLIGIHVTCACNVHNRSVLEQAGACTPCAALGKNEGLRIVGIHSSIDHGASRDGV